MTPDATLGTTVDTPGCTTCIIDRGTVRGGNLFHSFSNFSIPLGGSATFVGDPATVNVLTRVTGLSASRIEGMIDTKSVMPTANFFLINPNGVTFAEGSFLNVGGAVRISTADYIRLADGELFTAIPAPGELGLLWSAPPQAFGFLGNAPAAIALEPNAFLMVDPGQTLSLIGGNVSISGGFLFGQGGLVQIASVRTGEALIGSPDLGFGPSNQLGQVTISNGSFITAGTDFVLPGGTVVIRAGQLVIESGSLITSENFDAAGTTNGVDIRANESINIRDSAAIRTETFGSADAPSISIATPGTLTIGGGAVVESVSNVSDGRTGAIDIQVGRFELSDATIRTSAQAAGAGNITIQATGTVSVSGASGTISTGTFSADPLEIAGDIAIVAQDVAIRDNGRVASGGIQEQAGETLSITARDSIAISGGAGVSSLAFREDAGVVELSASRVVMDRGFITTSTFGAGAAGQVRVDANAVSLTNGAQISSSTQLGSPGAGGSVAVNARESISISGIGADADVSNKAFTGVRNSGILSTTNGSGNAGQIAVTTPVLVLSDGALMSVATQAGGDAGLLQAMVGVLQMSGGARMDSSTTAAGAGGAIAINGTAAISGANSGLFSTASSTGNAGAISVTGALLTVANLGTIDSSTTGAGTGGAIHVNASSQVNIDGGTIQADSLGSGVTGGITIVAGDRIMMNAGSISTRAVTSDGGNIVLTAPNIIRLENSQITTSVENGTGAGGNIFIDPQFVILNGSTISANAFGGPGGSVTIVANNFLADPTSVVSASSALSTPGTVQIQSPDNNVASDIAQLPRELVDASRLLRGGCSARRTGAPSSFTVVGRGGVPVDPDGYLPSFTASGAPSGARGAAAPPGFALAMVDADCWR